LSPVLAQQVPANPRLNRAIDFMAHHAAVADRLITALEGDRPQSEAVLGVAAPVRRDPLPGLCSGKHWPEAHQEGIGEEPMQALDICGTHLTQDESWCLQALQDRPPVAPTREDVEHGHALSVAHTLPRVLGTLSHLPGGLKPRVETVRRGFMPGFHAR